MLGGSGFTDLTSRLPVGVRAFAVAASTRAGRATGEKQPPGDGLVPVAGALGRHAEPARDFGTPESRRWLAPATGHLELLGSRGSTGAW